MVLLNRLKCFVIVKFENILFIVVFIILLVYLVFLLIGYKFFKFVFLYVLLFWGIWIGELVFVWFKKKKLKILLFFVWKLDWFRISYIYNIYIFMLWRSVFFEMNFGNWKFKC